MAKNIERLLRMIAKEKHSTPEAIRQEMQGSLDWEYEHGNAEFKKLMKKRFGNQKPTLEEFIAKSTLVRYLEEDEVS